MKAPDPVRAARDAEARRHFIEQGSTNPLSPEDWAASLVPVEARDVLEIGAGNGIFASRFLEARGGTIRRYLATDVSPLAIVPLEARLASQSAASVELADVLDLSRYSESFDAVVAVGAVGECGDPEKGIAQMLATLRRGGMAVVVTPHRDNLAELWTLVRTFDPAFPNQIQETVPFDSETAPEILDRLDRPWSLFDYENVLEATPDGAVLYVLSHFALLGLERDEEWTKGLHRFLTGWAGEFFWAVQRSAGYLIA